jgi:hypothetical protein
LNTSDSDERKRHNRAVKRNPNLDCPSNGGNRNFDRSDRGTTSSQLRSKGILHCAVVLVLAMCGIAPATAQSPPSPPLPTPEVQPVPAPQEGNKPPAPADTSIAGNWSGQLTQIERQTPYKLELVIGPRGGKTTYPDLDCTGKLSRVAASTSYVFFVETITKGRCPPGTVTATRVGDHLALFWFGRFKADTIVAFGSLARE